MSRVTASDVPAVRVSRVGVFMAPSLIARSRTPDIGLCGDCRHSRRVDSNKGATYWLCGRSATDSRYPKYPRLPLRHCTGYEPAVTPASLLDSEEWGLLQRGVTSMNP